MKPRHDIYQTITAELAAAIDAGAGNWRMPWHHEGGTVMRPSSAVGRAYTGINRLVLWASADAKGFKSGTWATYRQWTDVGAQVRRGETGTHVILWKRHERDDQSPVDDDNDDRGARFFARSFVVFNQSQVDGAPERAAAVSRPIAETVAGAKAYLESIGVAVHYGPWDAYYRPDQDRVYMPERENFDSDDDFISTLGHEIVHSTGSAQRLDRETLRDYFKDRSIRAREELVAEIGASFLMADLGLAYSPRPDHAAYVSSWLTALGNDTRAIFRAAAAAQAATDWIHTHAASAVPMAA